jgi:hypothetical protein
MAVRNNNANRGISQDLVIARDFSNNFLFLRKQREFLAAAILGAGGRDVVSRLGVDSPRGRFGKLCRHTSISPIKLGLKM